MIRDIIKFLSCFALLLQGCAIKSPVLKAPDLKPGSFLLYDGSALSESDLLTRLKGAQYILVGEAHRNSCDHKVQLKILKLLIQTCATNKQSKVNIRQDCPFLLGLEMVSQDKQEILDKFIQGQLSLQDLPQALNWENDWGYDFEFYAPIFKLAKQHRLKIIALNLPSKLISKIIHHGLESLSPDEKKYLPGQIIPAPEEQKKSLQEQFILHQDLIQKRKPDLSKFLLIQSIWDSKMAETAYLWQKKLNQPVLILAGAGHVENGWGIEYRLKKLTPQARIVRILPLRTPEELSSLNPLYFYCPMPEVAPLGMIIKKDDQGQFIVEKVLKPSKAYRAGIRTGDIIIQANKQNISASASLFDLHKIAIAAKKKGKPLCLKIKRGNTYLVVEIKLQ